MTENATGEDHSATGRIEILPVVGLPQFSTGIDIAGAILTAAPWLADGDILVVTSKIISKVEGRMVAAPADPDERDALRRKLVDDEAVRVVARKGRTLITENRLGIVQAASGVDGSNVSGDLLALLPADPDASAAALRETIATRAGISVAVVITDTMGRAWRIGQTDAAIGAAGLGVLHAYEGSTDRFGNPLVVTEIAIADEIAAAADLVKGKLRDVPVAVVRGLPVTSNGSVARDLVRPGVEDLFWLGTEEARGLGRREAILSRRSVREFSDEPLEPKEIRSALAEALTAPAPHHTHPVRFVWVHDVTRRRALLDAMAQQWRADLADDGRSQEDIERRITKGALLYNAPEMIVPVLVADDAHSYPDERRRRAEHTMFTVAAGAAVQGLLVALASRGIGSCWIGSTIFAAEITREHLGLGTSAYPMGAVAIGYPSQPLTVRPPADIADAVIEL